MKNFIFLVSIIFTLIGLIDLQSQSTSKTTPRLTTTARTTARTTPRTTPRPGPSTCYACTNCPYPFTRNGPGVTTVISQNGWCAKMSSNESPSSMTNRGADPLNTCASYGINGCRRRMVGAVETYLCCCRNSYCNTAVSISKSTIYIVSLSSIMIFLMKNIY
ncbi:unnamed protein product [Adineta steineri]|uniref:Activin types I and II receptor domain-containing protein n=3 Tax=Adineta steineri TaxID=433720 RepID=A0A814NHV5_9BILA|nr:unnamed protein product [Adineta steineri]CAF4091962.1 unnamed protein product [Adineta steineri]